MHIYLLGCSMTESAFCRVKLDWSSCCNNVLSSSLLNSNIESSDDPPLTCTLRLARAKAINKADMVSSSVTKNEDEIYVHISRVRCRFQSSRELFLRQIWVTTCEVLFLNIGPFGQCLPATINFTRHCFNFFLQRIGEHFGLLSYLTILSHRDLHWSNKMFHALPPYYLL